MNREYTIDQFTYLPDICDEIDRLIEQARITRNEKEKRNNRAAARSLILLYETHVGRKIFYKI